VVFPDGLNGDLPHDHQAVVRRCLEKDPAARFADAASLDVALAACRCSGSWTREEAARWWRSIAGEFVEMPDPVPTVDRASGPVPIADLRR
jgi:hypothetical protein